MLKHISSCVLGSCSKEQYANSAQMDVLKHLHMRIYARPCTADTEVVLAVQSCAAPHLISLSLDFFSSKPSLHLHHMKGPDLTIELYLSKKNMAVPRGHSQALRTTKKHYFGIKWWTLIPLSEITSMQHMQESAKTQAGTKGKTIYYTAFHVYGIYLLLFFLFLE